MHKLSLALLFWLLPTLALAQTPPAQAVASAHPLATRAGIDIMQQGGNAFDAAVAVSATLAVVEPYSSGFGGGGFWLLHQADEQRDIMVDGRERAPLSAHRDLYLDENGEVIPGLSMDGPLAAGVPGQAAALAHIAKRYGKLPLSQSLEAAIRHAREGFPVTEHYRRMAGFRLKALQASSDSARIFLKDGEVPPTGHLIRQPELATTLEQLARQGAAGFYAGKVAEQLVQGVRAHGGIWSKKDLQAYQVAERKPVSGHFQGYEIVTAAPPSSGGITMLTTLNILSELGVSSIDSLRGQHLFIEALRRSYRDRAQYLGDPDFVEIPVQRLLSTDYAAGLAAGIHPEKSSRSSDLPPIYLKDGTDTTHFSIIDLEGNYVAATLSINYPFGSGFTVPGTGVLLNDEMDDFSAKPGVPNAYGLVGAEANAIEGGKRMLSSMSPSFVRNGERVAVLGTPGGSRIITMVLQGILGVVDGSDPEQWVSRPRLHHQYLPDKVFVEEGAADFEGLQAMGHEVEIAKRSWGNMQALLWDRQARRVKAASDPRGEGQAQVSK